MNEVLIDTNVFIYALDKDSIYHQQSSQILTSSNNILFTTSKNISELFAATSKININRVAFNRFYGELKQNIGILFPTSESLEVFEKLIKKYKIIIDSGFWILDTGKTIFFTINQHQVSSIQYQASSINFSFFGKLFTTISYE